MGKPKVLKFRENDNYEVNFKTFDCITPSGKRKEIFMVVEAGAGYEIVHEMTMDEALEVALQLLSSIQEVKNQ